MKSLFFVLSLLFVNAYALEIGQSAPTTAMTDSDGNIHHIADFEGKWVVLEWTNFECPFVRKHYDSHNMQTLQKFYTNQDVVWLSVVSSAQGKQGYLAPEEVSAALEKEKASPTAVILDPSGELGHAYDAKTTPHMYVINPEGKLVYQGAIDSIRSVKPDDVKTAQNFVAAALDHGIAGQPIEIQETQAYGCSVKY